MNIDDLIEETRQLPIIPLAESTQYKNAQSLLIQYVNDSMAARSDINDLIGHNPHQVMYENHKNHASFMTSVFSVNHYEMLVRIVVWVYRAYHAHSFSYDYFPIALNAWIKAIDSVIVYRQMNSVKSVYQWMIKHHDDFIDVSQNSSEQTPQTKHNYVHIKDTFLKALLDGDHGICISLVKEHIRSSDDLQQLYLQVIQPSMYEIGMLWESGSISVAQEHLASAVVGRVLANVNAEKLRKSNSSGKIIVSASPNEYHEIGAWMISDMLRIDGWDVLYLGANTPANDLIDLAKSYKPDILAISVTMPFNLDRTKSLIEKTKKDHSLETTKIIVGGRAFNEFPGLWKHVGADSFLPSINGITSKARTLAGKQ